jgi:hypothetical protein
MITGKKKANFSEKDPFHCHFIYIKFHMECSGIEVSPL